MNGWINVILQIKQILIHVAYVWKQERTTAQNRQGLVVSEYI